MTLEKTIVGSFGIVVLISGFVIGLMRLPYYINLNATEGTVVQVEFIKHSNNKNEPWQWHYIPWVEYFNDKGEKIKKRMVNYMTSTNAYKKGMTIGVLLNPNDSKEVYIVTNKFWQYPIGLMLFGLLVFGLTRWI